MNIMNIMKLKDFLSLIQDEEVRIELEIDFEDDVDYIYTHFWLSDFLTDDDTAKYYKDFKVSGFSFEPEDEKNAQIRISIKQ